MTAPSEKPQIETLVGMTGTVTHAPYCAPQRTMPLRDRRGNDAVPVFGDWLSTLASLEGAA